MATRTGQANFRKSAESSLARFLRSSAAAVLVTAAILFATTTADARITKIQIISRSPAFGGFSFPGVGPYERIIGKGFGEISPTDRHNNTIVDIGLAPRNAKGKVEYSFDFYILKPVDLSKGNHKVFYEAPNRGAKLFGDFNRSTGGDDPAASSDPAGTFLAPRGYTMVWSGWDFAAGTDNSDFNLTITLPIAKNPDGSSITGPAYEYIVSSPSRRFVSADLPRRDPRSRPRRRSPIACTWTTRHRRSRRPAGSTRTTAGPFGCFPREQALAPNDIYEFSYTAKDPTVNGIGFAAVRDFNSFLRYAAADSGGTSNPLAGDVTRIYTFAFSQPARMLNDFRNLGFNEDENGKIVFDGMLQWIAAGDGINMNYRFSQPGRTERNRQDQLYVEGVFPFANQRTTDPITGKTAGRYDKCTMTKTCPLAMEVYSANEYWVKAASLFTTDPTRREGSSRSSDGPGLFHLQPSARHRKADDERELPAVPESSGFGAGAARFVGRAGQMVHQGHRAAAQPDSAFVRWHARPALAAKRRRLSQNSRGHVHGAEVDALLVRLRSQVLQHRHHDRESAGR